MGLFASRSLLLPPLAVILSAGAALAQDITRVVAAADQAIGRIIVEGDVFTSSGSVFVFGHDDRGQPLFLTNFHVTNMDGPITVFFLHDNATVAAFRGEVIASSSAMDMAALTLSPLEAAGFAPQEIALALRPILKGEEVIALGYPGASDDVLSSDSNVAMFETTLTQGLVSKVAVAPWKDEAGQSLGVPVEQIQHTAAINHGNSGGPLLDGCGQVVGMNTAGMLADNIYLASSSRSIADFLAAAGIGFDRTVPPCGAVAAVPATAAPAAPAPPPADAVQVPSPDVAPEPSSGPPAADAAGGIPVWLAVAGMLTAVAAVVGAVGFAVSRGTANRRDEVLVSQLQGAATIPIRVRAGGVALPAHGVTAEALSRGVTVGRGAEADVTVDVAGVSRQHLRLELSGRQLLVSDMGSTNGTTVDGVALKPGQRRQVNSRSVILLAGVAELMLGRG